MKKLFGLVILLLLLFAAANVILWTEHFIQSSYVDSSGGRTNVLILGIGGGNHDGADLTDTMIVLSLNTTKKTMAMISVPRDIWIDSLKDKINSAYHYGNLKEKGGGLVLAKVITEDVTGLPIQYVVVIDFSGFQKVIDEVGGIDLNVPTAFTDNAYPIPGMEHYSCPGDPTDACDLETVHFDAGPQHMDGARALIYARSRHAEGAEGSDFARSRRQQIIMLALKDKLMNPASWFTFSRIEALPSLLASTTVTDINLMQEFRIGKSFVNVKESDIQRISFEDHLSNPPEYLYNNLYVLVPQTDWDDIHTYINAKLQ